MIRSILSRLEQTQSQSLPESRFQTICKPHDGIFHQSPKSRPAAVRIQIFWNFLFTRKRLLGHCRFQNHLPTNTRVSIATSPFFATTQQKALEQFMSYSHIYVNKFFGKTIKNPDFCKNLACKLVGQSGALWWILEDFESKALPTSDGNIRHTNLLCGRISPQPRRQESTHDSVVMALA